MGHVHTSPSAKRHLADIVSYIAKDNLPAALGWLENIEAVFDVLAAHPGIGQIVQTKHFGMVRRHVFGNYLIYYRPIKDGVEVLAVVHGSREQNRIK